MTAETNPTAPVEQVFRPPLMPMSTPMIESHQLLGNGRECWITHAGQTYRLCHTRNDKLILIK